MLRLVILSVVPWVWAAAAILPNGFGEQAINGLSNATAMAIAPDGRIFVCQQTGELRVIQNGILLTTPAKTLSVDSAGERGLLGVAFDPNFQSNSFIYLYYTVPGSPPHNRVSRFTMSGNVVTGAETQILNLEDLGASNHNGGAIHFGPDGKLYVAVGENANSANSQDARNKLGKMLRINSDGSIPTDNPAFACSPQPCTPQPLWAMGLRNPFTFTFQPGTGRMFINDVGQSAWEEVNDGIAGSNYGWPTTEGPTNNPAFRSPLYAYDHGQGCAIVGAAFYNPTVATFPSQYVGKYFFADLCSGWIRWIDPASPTVATDFATGVNSPVDLAVSPQGSLYYLARGSGAVYKVDFTGGQGPQISQHPANVTVPVGQPAMFSVQATGTPTLTYQWQRNTVAINGATSSSYTLSPTVIGDNGAQFRVVVSNSFGNATSNPATLTVTQNQAPAATINFPAAGSLYSGGDIITYAGVGNDPEDHALPASAFTWQIDFHHDTHTHPFLPATTGAMGGTVAIPTMGETSANVWYRFHLTVRDSGGLTGTAFVDVFPRKSTITLQTNPPGLQSTLDGQPFITPYSVEGVVGIVRTLGAFTQASGGARYQFASWTDGGASTHNIATPLASTTYTATYLTQYPLTLAISPAATGSIAASPISADGYYNSGTVVNLTANPGPGYAFSGWSGDLNGSLNPQSVTMNASHTVTANFTALSICSYSLARTTASVSAGGDVVKTDVITNAGCAWQSTSDAPWITFPTGASGSGGGPLRFTVATNPGAADRTGNVTLAGNTLTVTQAAAGCSALFESATVTIAPAGGAFSVGVTAPFNCVWSPSAAPAWIQVSAGARGGSGSVAYTVSANSTSTARTGSIVVASQTLQVVQAGLNEPVLFQDVPLSHPYFEFISLLKTNNVTTGCTANQYCPAATVTRGQVAVFVIRSLFGGDLFTFPGSPYFTDVPATHPFFAHIQKMKELGITLGCSDLRYCPDDPVTRGQMAVFLVRSRLGVSAVQPFPYPATPYFQDVPASHPYFPFIQKLRELGVTAGCAPATYCPDAPNTRGEMAVFVIRDLFTP